MEVQVYNRIPNLCTKVPELPLDPDNPGYRNPARAKPPLDTVMKYVTAEEWTQLAQAVNASIKRHHYCHSIVTPIMAVTLGLCFCPLWYVGCMMGSRVNEDVAKLPVSQKLSERGIALHWYPPGDLGGAGGMIFTISSETTPIPAVPATPAQPQQVQVEVMGR